MIESSPLSDLAHDARARRARKRAVVVSVTFADAPGSMQTREGAVQYEQGDALVCGAAGDRWPIARDRFLATYAPVAPLASGEPGRYRKRPQTVLARRMDAPFCVPLPDDRGTLRGEAGDWLVQYAPGDLAVVGAEIFKQTYELL
ncbi:MAG TPA: PGDYG domain-containing protein [Casimicrobiaceae bacterium]|nr:PGDYG domain-containing protein [Casimicrobiaceae bacterium]